VLEPLARRIAHEHASAELRIDRRLVPYYLRAIHLLTSVFSPDVRAVDNVPDSGPALVVGNHSCMFWMPDAAVILDAVTTRRGAGSPTYALAYDLLFTVPGFGRLIRLLGLVPADEEPATRALHEGAVVVVFPGGDHDACRPWSERDTIAFGGHKGFIRLALRTGVPVVPVVAHGAHHGMLVLARGEPVARRLGLAGVRV
jgi:1-acyl-sn-glycerol-3-phosphate acyltransferase